MTVQGLTLVAQPKLFTKIQLLLTQAKMLFSPSLQAWLTTWKNNIGMIAFMPKFEQILSQQVLKCSFVHTNRCMYFELWTFFCNNFRYVIDFEYHVYIGCLQPSVDDTRIKTVIKQCQTVSTCHKRK